MSALKGRVCAGHRRVARHRARDCAPTGASEVPASPSTTCRTKAPPRRPFRRFNETKDSHVRRVEGGD